MKNILTSTTLGSQVLFVISILMTVFGVYTYGFGLTELSLVILGYFMYGSLGIVVTYHRYLTHNSYKTHPLITKIFSILGALGGTGSTIAWVAIHINHHLKSDKLTDPHSPKYNGFKIFNLDYEKGISSDTKWRMRHLVTDKFHQFLHRYYFGIIALWFTILCLMGGLSLAIWMHLTASVVTVFMSNLVNYIGHKPDMLGGYRRYNLNDDSTNNWLWSIVSWGETWHNNHHRHPKSFSCGEKWWEIDISAYIIRLIKI